MHTSEANRRAAAKTLVAAQKPLFARPGWKGRHGFSWYCFGVKSAERLQDPAK
jgi:hypothetical protein